MFQTAIRSYPMEKSLKHRPNKLPESSGGVKTMPQGYVK